MIVYLERTKEGYKEQGVDHEKYSDNIMDIGHT